jgi:acyl-CoA synthetase (AMP-forming)/AMP-acid ligase II
MAEVMQPSTPEACALELQRYGTHGTPTEHAHLDLPEKLLPLTFSSFTQIYRALEVIPTIKDYVAAGFRLKDDVAVALFIVLDDPSVDTCPPKLLSDIKNGIRNSLTPRHVPSHVVVVKAVPYTRSGKRMELSVNRAINGDTLRNVSSMVNPECIQEYVEIGQGLRAAGN